MPDCRAEPSVWKSCAKSPEVLLAALAQEAALDVLVSSATAVLDVLLLDVLVSAVLVPPVELVLDVEPLTNTNTSISELPPELPEDFA